MLFSESSAGCTLDLSKEDFNLDILFKQLFMYNWPWRCIHILYGWSLNFMTYHLLRKVQAPSQAYSPLDHLNLSAESYHRQSPAQKELETVGLSTP